ncbi:hypothetical protein ACFYU5_20740 [Nocardia aobensis]|uniref:ESAT-6-like protein EsxB n=3 Tax=Nocardia TaxID=1817 RepID=A0A231GT32_9NOCA|nr:MULTISPECIES: hypothetical protein [Nocardia]MDR7169015.1 uncharacterized protein YukE [Nocardia kruczakiae]OXR39705.1 hypothetical protein B7C42_08219 [Nocardia cerradoensis]
MAGNMYFNFAHVDEHHTTLKGLGQAMEDNVNHLRNLQQTLASLLGGATSEAYQEVSGNLNKLLAAHQANLVKLNTQIHFAAGSQGMVQTADKASAASMRG